MPIYPYKCEAGHTFEVWQKVSDPKPTFCIAIVNEEGKVWNEEGAFVGPTKICGLPVEYTWPAAGFNATELELNRSTNQSYGGKSEAGHRGDKSYGKV